MFKKNYFVTIMISLTLISSCSLFFGEELGTGSIQINVYEQIETRTFLPTSLQADIVDYVFNVTGPNDQILDEIVQESKELLLETLEPGEWNISVIGRNGSGQSVASATKSVTVIAGQSVTDSVQLTQLSGEGTLSVTTSWPAEFSVDSVIMTISKTSEEDQVIDLEISENTATYTSLIGTGSYNLNITLKKNGQNIAPPRVSAALIYKDMTTSGTMDFTADEMTGMVSQPTVDILGGTYTVVQEVSITCATDRATILYTLDGTTPSIDNGTIYEGTVTVSSTSQLQAIAYLDGWVNSDIMQISYTINGNASLSVINPDIVDITLSTTKTTITDNENITIIATPTIPVDSYSWYVDGVLVHTGSNEFVFGSGENLWIGPHTVTVIVEKSGISFSSMMYVQIVSE